MVVIHLQSVEPDLELCLVRHHHVIRNIDSNGLHDDNWLRKLRPVSYGGIFGVYEMRAYIRKLFHLDFKL